MTALSAGPDTQPILSVAELTLAIKDRLETGFPAVWVGGEISNFSAQQSGHCYFTLKDDQAQIRAVIWRNVASRLAHTLEDGLEVVCYGDLEVYAPRGTYQLVVRRIEPRGLGGLERALRLLREKLAAEGLFDPARKRPLPRFPRRIALVTSPTGAAIRDFLEVLKRRWRGVDVLLFPVRVQGQGAKEEIAAALAQVNRWAEKFDCVVLTRGGGSLEDLWAFNEEQVVRAIHACRLPLVSAIGHEIDVTLSDLAADVRALTPSEAAELVVPSAAELTTHLTAIRERLGLALKRRAALGRAQLVGLAARRVLRRPWERVHDLAQRLDELDARGLRAMRQLLATARQRIQQSGAQLEALSPLAVLGRGYGVTRKHPAGAVVTRAISLTRGDLLRTRLAVGSFLSRVEEVQANE